MAGAMEEFRDMAAQAKKTLVHEPCGELPQINADRELIVRVIENLLTNAIKFTREGGKVTLSASKDMMRGTVKVCVSDEGQGIPAELRERVFDKFFQVEAREAGKPSGTGLGLTLCKMAIDAHGGKIWVEGEVGKGSDFYFEVPHNPPPTA